MQTTGQRRTTAMPCMTLDREKIMEPGGGIIELDNRCADFAESGYDHGAQFRTIIAWTLFKVQ